MKFLFLLFEKFNFYFRNNVLLETGFTQREHRKWYAKKPECVAGKAITEESLVSVGIKDILSLMMFLFVGYVVSFSIMIIEIIVFRYSSEKQGIHKPFMHTKQ